MLIFKLANVFGKIISFNRYHIFTTLSHTPGFSLKAAAKVVTFLFLPKSFLPFFCYKTYFSAKQLTKSAF